MEVSSHALAMGRVGGVRFAVGGYTNFGLDHLDFHADVDDYFAAKAQLFDGRCRGRGAQPRRPGADAAGQARPRSPTRPPATRRPPGAPPTSPATASASASPRTARTGRGAAPAWRCPAGTTSPTRCWRIACAGRGRGRPGDRGRRRRRLPRACPAGWSGSTRPAPVLGVVDYAHKPDAIVAALAALRELAGPRRPADLRDRRRRRPGPGQAPADGRGRGARRRPGDRHRRQPAHRGPGRDPGRGAAPGADAGRRAAEVIEVAGPPGGDRRGGRAGRARATWSRCSARATSGARRSTARCCRSTTGSSWPRAAPPASAPAGSRVIAHDAWPRSPRSLGGRLVDADPAGRRSPARSSSTRARSRPGGCSSRSPGEKVDGHDFAAAAVAAGAVAVLGTRPVDGVPTIVVADPLAAMGRLARAVRRPAARADRHRGHRLVRQDHHQGPDRPAARPARPDRGAGRARSTTSSACRTRCCRPTPDTRFLVLEMGARGRRAPRATCARSRRRGSAWCSTSASRTSASSARSRRIAAGQGRAGRGAAGRTGWRCSTPTTRGCAAMAARTAARVVLVGEAPDADVRADGRDAGRARPGRVHPGHAGGSRAGAARVTGRHQVGNTLAGGGGRPRAGHAAGRAGRRRSASCGWSRPDGWMSSTAPTVSRSSTTRTTPTRPRRRPRCGRWPAIGPGRRTRRRARLPGRAGRRASGPATRRSAGSPPSWASTG